MENKLMSKEQGTEWERAHSLLQNILYAMSAVPNRGIPKKYNKGTFKTTYEIAATIEDFLKEVEEDES